MTKKPNLPPAEYQITKKDAADRLGVTLMTIDRAIQRGNLRKHVLENGYNVVLDIREVDALTVWRPTVGPRV